MLTNTTRKLATRVLITTLAWEKASFRGKGFGFKNTPPAESSHHLSASAN